MSENMTNSYVYLPKDTVEEPFYTVAEAMRLTGRSSTKFRYEPNKRELDARGADLSQRVWRIPRTALIEMGWLEPDAPLTAEPVEGPTIRSSQARIIELAELNSGLTAELDALRLEVSELRGEVATLHDLVIEKDRLLSAAQATIEAKEAEVANLTALFNNK